MSKDADKAIGIPGRETSRPLPKRVYKRAEAGPAQASNSFPVLLDGRPARTPKGRELAMPTRPLAEAVAREWDTQGQLIDPSVMPLTRLVNTVLDGVQGRENDVRDDIVKYAGSDLVCYRAEGPGELVQRQAGAWDPVLAWAADRFDLELALSRGIVPVTQSSVAMDRVRGVVVPLDAFRLAALHIMVTLTGSALLGLALLHGHLSVDAAWAAAHVDEDWQISQWGEDAEAAARRRAREQDMRAAAELLRLLD